MDIIKRDGRKVPFDAAKIEKAILAAFNEVDGNITDYAKDKANNIAQYISNENSTHELTIEEIQDLVEKGLMATKRKDVAKAYVLYRNKRTERRQRNSQLMKIIGVKLSATDIQNQNANMDEASFGGRKGEAANELLKTFALENCMSKMARENHENNEIYIHDLDSYALGMQNCLSVPFDDLLKNGFKTRQTDVRPANSINTAFQLVAVLFQLQSLQQYGGCSATHLDWTMVPYVKKSFQKHFRDGLIYLENQNPDEWFNLFSDFSITDKYYKSAKKAYKYATDMTERELKQAVEGMYHNLK